MIFCHHTYINDVLWRMFDCLNKHEIHGLYYVINNQCSFTLSLTCDDSVLDFMAKEHKCTIILTLYQLISYCYSHFDFFDSLKHCFFLIISTIVIEISEIINIATEEEAMLIVRVGTPLTEMLQTSINDWRSHCLLQFYKSVFIGDTNFLQKVAPI